MPTLRPVRPVGNRSGASLHFASITLNLALLTLAACSPGEARAPIAQTVAAGWVTVRRDDTLLARYSEARVSAVVDGGHLSIELASPYGTHRLVIEVDGIVPGRYRLAPVFEPGTATLLLVSRGVPGRISPDQGELSLTMMRDGRCSGTFAGQARDQGFLYRFEGTFELVPVRRL